ncbi:MAG TPA: ABC transporter permease subunit [Ktedonobacterales bacterium]
MNIFAQMAEYIADPQHAFGQHTVDTLTLCIVPIVLSFVIALPLGILVAPRPLAAFLAANLSGLMRAVPTLAALVIIVLLLNRIGFIPSVIALTALGIPPILLNTIAGLRGVDPASIDAARGMGMTRLQILTRIEIPLVLPVVAAGVRTSAVQIVATVPLAGLIGGGGYGEYINAGLGQEVHQIDLLVGAVAIALLALLTEAIFATVQRMVTPAGLRVAEQLAPAAEQTAPERQPVAA